MSDISFSDILSILSILFGGGGIISLVGNLQLRKESKARAENFEANTEEIRNQIVKQLKEQLVEQNKELVQQNKELVQQNKELMADREELKDKVEALTQQGKEKDEQYKKDQERWRAGYQKLEDRIRANEEDLRHERDHNSRLIRELDDTKREYKASTENYIVKIGSLESKVAQQDGAIETIAKKTDQLHLPARDGAA